MDEPKRGSGRTPWDDLLRDPLVRLMMTADRVNSGELHELLLAAADRRLALRRAVADTAEVEMSLSPADAAYRPGVGIALFNTQGEVLVGRRADNAQDAWQMPQGGIEPGEAPQEAALRELREEIGTDNVEVIAESRGWLRYDLPPHLIGVAWGGRWRGQQQKWFAMRFRGADPEITVATEHPEFAEWRWVPAARALELIVGFKRQLYLDVLRDFGGIGTAPPQTSGRDPGPEDADERAG